MRRKWLAFVALLLVGYVIYVAVGIYQFAPESDGVGDRGSLAVYQIMTINRISITVNEG